MLQSQLVAFPYVDIERDKVNLSHYELPVEFDQERLMIDVGRIGQIARWAGLGTVSAMTDVKFEPDYVLGDVLDQHRLSVAAEAVSPWPPLADVSVCTYKAQQKLDKRKWSKLYESYRYAPTRLLVDAQQRDDRLALSEEFPAGALDVNGQALALQSSLATGLSRAASLRQRQRYAMHMDQVSLGVIATGAVLEFANVIEIQVGASPSGLAWLFGGTALLSARGAHRARKQGFQRSERQLTLLFHQDRKLAAQLLAHTSDLVKIQT